MLKRNTLESVHVPPSLSIWDLFEFEQSLRDTRVPGTLQILGHRESLKIVLLKVQHAHSHLRGLLQSRPEFSSLGGAEGVYIYHSSQANVATVLGSCQGSLQELPGMVYSPFRALQPF